MARLAIKGHPTRGKEVIEILEMLGGNNVDHYSGFYASWHYTIVNNKIVWGYLCAQKSNFIIFTLEEFLEKFPYKVGDKVTLDKYPCVIIGMNWDCDDIIYYVKGMDFSKGVYSTDKDLQPYEEETMEEDKKAKGYCTEESEDSGKNPKKAWFTFWCNDFADEVELCLEDKELVQKDGKWFVVKRKKEYPKTYKECCDVLGLSTMDNDAKGYKGDLIIRFQELLIARDAYWKIAGEQMGLGKPWEPDWTDNYQKKWTINFYQGEINFTTGPNVQFILAFPTEEMRDAFYENFKELIEQCKELL